MAGTVATPPDLGFCGRDDGFCADLVVLHFLGAGFSEQTVPPGADAEQSAADDHVLVREWRRGRRRLVVVEVAPSAAGPSTPRARLLAGVCAAGGAGGGHAAGSQPLDGGHAGRHRRGAHCGFAANLFTLVSDTVPKQAVSSVVGIGGMAGALDGDGVCPNRVAGSGSYPQQLLCSICSRIAGIPGGPQRHSRAVAPSGDDEIGWHGARVGVKGRPPAGSDVKKTNSSSPEPLAMVEAGERNNHPC